MSYSKKTWTNRTSEYPNRYRMHSTNGNIADVSIIPNEGSITSEGDRFDAYTMNNLETRIANGFSSVDSSMSTLDTTLRGLITAEQTRATGIENLLRGDVDTNTSGLAAEITRATAKENDIADDLASEITRATSIENGLRTDITSLQGRVTDTESNVNTLTSRISSLEQSVEIETDRATDAETEIAGNLADEVTRATTTEANLSTRISANASNISANTSSINAEVSRATQAENEIRDYVDAKVSATLHPKGTITFANLPSLSASVVNNVYNISDAFTTTADFTEGAGKSYPVGTNVAIINVGTEETPTYKYDAMSGFVDLSPYAKKSALSAVATSGSYNDLSNKPSIPSKISDLTNDSDFVENTDYATTSKAGIVKPDGTTITVDADGTMHSQAQGGHTIVNSSGTELTSRSKLKFLNATVTDDATNDQTIITPSGSQITVDSDLSTTSTNPVQNKVVTYEARLKTWIGTCTTTASTQAKVATVDNGFTLTKGVRIGIKFTHTNTYSSTTSAPITLNVNGTGAKNIWYNNTHSDAGNTGTNTTAYGVAGRYNFYIYDGTYWVWDGCGVDNSTTYSAMSVSELTTGTATTQRTVRADYLKNGIETIIKNKTDTSLDTGSNNPIANSAVATAVQTLTNKVDTNTSNISTLNTKTTNKVLYLTSVACSATTGNFVSYSNSAITADHVVAECVFANPSAITTDVTWTTANGSVTLNGTCTSATTANLVLVKKDN